MNGGGRGRGREAREVSSLPLVLLHLDLLLAQRENQAASTAAAQLIQLTGPAAASTVRLLQFRSAQPCNLPPCFIYLSSFSCLHNITPQCSRRTSHPLSYAQESRATLDSAMLKAGARDGESSTAAVPSSHSTDELPAIFSPGKGVIYSPCKAGRAPSTALSPTRTRGLRSGSAPHQHLAYPILTLLSWTLNPLPYTCVPSSARPRSRPASIPSKQQAMSLRWPALPHSV